MPRKQTPCIACGKPSHGKRCRKCNTEFRNVNAVTRQEGYKRFWYTKKKYGIDEEEFWTWWIVQRGKCYICKIDMKQPTKTRGQGLDTCCLDHDHKTRQFRALLCAGCNKGLGLFNENPTALRNAAKYLEMSK